MSKLTQLLSLVCRLIVAGVFLYASYDKVWEPANFARSVAQYDLIPLWMVNPGSVVLAWLEFLVGLMLLVGLYTRAAAIWASLLLVFFTGLMIYSGITGAGFDCGCFPGGPPGEAHQAGWDGVWRDLAFLIPALMLTRRPGTWVSMRS